MTPPIDPRRKLLHLSEKAYGLWTQAIETTLHNLLTE